MSTLKAALGGVWICVRIWTLSAVIFHRMHFNVITSEHVAASRDGYSKYAAHDAHIWQRLWTLGIRCSNFRIWHHIYRKEGVISYWLCEFIVSFNPRAAIVFGLRVLGIFDCGSALFSGHAEKVFAGPVYRMFECCLWYVWCMFLFEHWRQALRSVAQLLLILELFFYKTCILYHASLLIMFSISFLVLDTKCYGLHFGMFILS